MSALPKRWLVSFEYTAAFYRDDGTLSTVGPSHMTTLIDEHPAKYFSDMRRHYDKARGTPVGKRGVSCRGDMLGAVYSMIEVPAGTLTEDEIDDFS